MLQRCKLILALSVLGCGVQSASAAVTPEEAKKLGTTLTPWGAMVAGNADGTIPAYAGGLTKPPASYDKSKPGWRPDPFADEKPRLRIDSKNVDAHKDKLTPGTLALIKRFPETFYLEVFPTHRTAAYPKEWLDNSVKNATRCALNGEDGGLDISKGCGGGAAFPIPTNGVEVLWNKLTSYRGGGIYKPNSTLVYVKPSGERVQTARANWYASWPQGDPAANRGDLSYVLRVEFIGPSRLAGAVSLITDNATDLSRKAYSYQPSTRRVRMSPDFAADTPVATKGGAELYDDDNFFMGKPDRYDWKLMGKKEIYVPYNTYRMVYGDAKGGCGFEEVATKDHPKSSCVRWELHRVWHVTATLKSGKRHVYHKRDLYIDEDTMSTGIAENYDQTGNLYRYNMNPAAPMYDALVPGFGDQIVIDLVSGIYTWFQTTGGLTVVPSNPALLPPDSAATHLLK